MDMSLNVMAELMYCLPNEAANVKIKKLRFPHGKVGGTKVQLVTSLVCCLNTALNKFISPLFKSQGSMVKKAAVSSACCTSPRYLGALHWAGSAILPTCNKAHCVQYETVKDHPVAHNRKLGNEWLHSEMHLKKTKG